MKINHFEAFAKFIMSKCYYLSAYYLYFQLVKHTILEFKWCP